MISRKKRSLWSDQRRAMRRAGLIRSSRFLSRFNMARPNTVLGQKLRLNRTVELTTGIESVIINQSYDLYAGLSSSQDWASTQNLYAKFKCYKIVVTMTPTIDPRPGITYFAIGYDKNNGNAPGQLNTISDLQVFKAFDSLYGANGNKLRFVPISSSPPPHSTSDTNLKLGFLKMYGRFKENESCMMLYISYYLIVGDTQ